jgi:PAS domain S-box-containing protein
MEEAQPEKVAVITTHAAFERLQQQAATLGLSPTDLQAVLAEALAQQQALLQENQQLHATQQQLAGSAARLHAAEAVAGMGSYELNLISGTLHFSAGMFRLFGEAPDSFPPSLEWIDDRSHPEDAATVRRVLEQATHDRQPYHYTRRIRRADGQWRTLESHGRVVCDEADAAIRFEGVVEDKTDQQHTEQALRASEEQFKLFVLASSNVVYKVSSDWRHMYQLAGKEFLADTNDNTDSWLRIYVPAEDQPRVAAAIARAVETKSLFELEHQVFRVDGSVGWVHSRAVPVFTAQGELLEWVGTASDITQRKQAEQGLQANRELLQATIDSSLDMIQVFEAVRNEEGEIVDFVWRLNNPTAASIYGDVIGQRLLARNPGALENGIFDTFKRVVETGQPDQSERHYTSEPFDQWYFQSTVKLHDGVATTTANITERKKTAQEILRLKDEIAQHAANKYHTLFNAIDEGFCLVELLYDEQGEVADYRFLEVNPVFERQTGLVNVQGQLGSAIAPGTEQYWLKLYAEVVKTGQPQRFENYHSPTGRWYEAYASQVGGTGSKQVCIVFRNITERKHAEHRQAFLLQLSDALRPVADAAAAQEAATRVGREFFHADRCYYGEIQAGRCLIRRDASAEGLPSVAGTYELHTMPIFQAVVDAGEPFVVEDVRTSELVDEGLRQLCVQLQVISFVDVPVIKDGQPVGILCMVQSTPRRWLPLEIDLVRETAERTWAAIEHAQAEASLRDSQTWLQVALSAAELGTFVWHVAEDRTEEDARARIHFGLPPNSTVTLADALVTTFHPEDGPRYVAAVGRAIDPAGPGTLHEEFRIRHPDGQERWMAVSATTVFEGTPPAAVRLAGVLADVTERKHAEQRQQFLLQLNDVLRPLAEPLALQQAALHFVADQLGLDRLLYNEIDPGVTTYTVRACYAREGFEAYGGEQPMGPFTESVRALREGFTKVVYDVETDESFSPEEKAICAGIRVRAFVTVPLLKNGQGVLNLVAHSSQPRPWTPQEVSLLEETAERTWAAVERAQTEEALRHSEEQFRTVANLVPDLLWRSEADGNSTWCNQRWLDYTGQTIEEVVGFGWADAIHPDDQPDSVQAYRAAVQQGELWRWEHRIRSAAGPYRWFLVTVMPARNEQGAITHWFGAATDIEAHKQSEEQLRTFAARLEAQVAERTQELQASRDLLQSVFDTSLVMLVVSQAIRNAHGALEDFAIALVNHEVVHEIGRNDLVGKRLTDVFPGVKAAGLFDLMCRTVETGEAQQTELFYPFEGLGKWYACMFVKLDDGLVITCLDITPRKLAEQEQQRSFTLLQQAEAVAGLGSWSYDLAKAQLFLSEGMYQLLGLPPGQSVGPEIYLDLVVEEDRKRAQQMVQQILAGAADCEDTLRLRVGNQTKTVRLQAIVLRDAQNQPVRVLGVDLDISEERRLEQENLRLRLGQQRALFEAVQQAQETERKRIAEDLHNGVGQLLYATKLRLDKLHAPVLNTDPVLAAARQEADNLLASAIRQTRALSHELVPMVLQEFGLEAALQDVCRQLSTPQLQLHGQVMFDERVPTLPMPLQLALYRMAQELGLNIIKHAHGATEASLELETTPGFVLLRAEDNGPGFAVDPATAPGLGLRTIRDRVALLNGTLELGHGSGFGTFVRLRIPLADVPPAAI